MRKLLKELNNWWKHNKGFHDLTKWQRLVIFDFVVDYIIEADEHNGRQSGQN